MTFRARLLVAFLVAVLLPMIVLALFIRGEMTRRLTAQYERRVASTVEVIEEDLAQRDTGIAEALAVVRGAIADDNRFRRGAVDRAADERRYLLDFAAGAMRLTGLSMLQIQDESGRILSSGHFRNEYDRLEPALPRLLASLGGRVALVRARAPEAPFLALARVDSVQLGTRRFHIVGGIRVGDRFLARLARGGETAVTLTSPSYTAGDSVRASSEDAGEGSEATGGRTIVRELSVPLVDADRESVVMATFRVSHRLDELDRLRASIDRWFLVAVFASAVLVVLVVTWLASRISRPLTELAEKTSRIDLDRLDIEFDTRRNDEIGVLSRLLGAMTGRLRASALLIKDAERRATLGEMARQVNHDIKNGLTPLRNVFRHLTQVSRENPGELPEVLRAREGTIESGLSYLENLASDYARISRRGERRPCDVAEIARTVARDRHGTDGAVVRADASGPAVVHGDPMALRRVLENLVDNAIESLESGRGDVTIAVGRVDDAGGEGDRVRVAVSDTGRGMTEEERARAFDDFYTTREDGTGLGLSIVRRLVMDLEGSIDVQSEPGRGSTFTIEIPAAATGEKE